MRYAVLGWAWMLLVAVGHGNSRAQEATGPRERGAVAYLILHKAGSALGFYNSSGRLIDTVPVGTHPHEMVLAPDGRHVYVADNGVMLLTDSGDGGNTVSIVDITDRKRIGVISLDRFRDRGLNFRNTIRPVIFHQRRAVDEDHEAERSLASVS